MNSVKQAGGNAGEDSKIEMELILVEKYIHKIKIALNNY